MRVEVRVGAGSRAVGLTGTYTVPHVWTEQGIVVDGGGTGAHLLLTAVGCCLLNDVYREAQPGVDVGGVLVEVAGDFDAETWSRSSLTYDVLVDSTDDAEVVGALLDRVAEIAEIPRVLRGDVSVVRR